MFSLTSFATLICCAATVVVAAGACTGKCKTVQLTTGTVEGGDNVDGGVHFLGLPFAAPPVNGLRWQPPAPAANWSGTRKATEYNAACMQGNSAIYTKYGNSEDCLYLNVWLPKGIGSTPPAQGLPVMLFFHGGSWESGSASSDLYGGDADANMYKNTIIVTANYRLSIYGWLGSEHLRATDGSTGNFGLQDQRAAMDWVKQNAAAFNGDPKRLTIFGESAGAGSVSVHLVSPRSAGHFDRAIIESSAPNAPWVAMPMVVAEQRFAALASASGCSSARGAGAADGASDPAAVVACMRAKNGTELYQYKPHGPWLDEWAPVIDGVEVVAEPALLAAQGKVHDVPVMLGTNRDEGTLFVPVTANASDADFAYWVNKTFTTGHDAAVLNSVYSPSKYNATKDATAAFWALAAILGDGLMTCPARRSARILGQDAARKSGTWRYFFQHELSLLRTIEAVGKTHAYGVCHGSELPLVFHIDAILGLDAEKELSKQVVKWWETFAATGMPGATVAEWPPAGSATSPNSTMVWDVVKDDHGVLSKPKYTLESDQYQNNFCELWDVVPFNFSIALYGM